MMVADVDEKESSGGSWCERCGGYERVCEIKRSTFLIGLGRPRIGVITCQIGTGTCLIGDGKLTLTRKSLKSQLLMMICPISSHLSPSRPQLYHHLRTRSSLIPLYLSMPWSRVNTKYSIHWVLHSPSTVYTEYGIHRILHQPNINCLTPPSTPPILIDHGLQVHLWVHSISASVHLQSRSIMTSECISKFTRSRPPSAFLSSLDLGLSSCPNLLNHGVQVQNWIHSISASKCIPKLARSRSPCASP